MTVSKDERSSRVSEEVETEPSCRFCRESEFLSTAASEEREPRMFSEGLELDAASISVPKFTGGRLMVSECLTLPLGGDCSALERSGLAPLLLSLIFSNQILNRPANFLQIMDQKLKSQQWEL